MSKAIATIRLAPGQVGFYDPLSRIHLTRGNPVATVYSGTNCAALRRNVKSGIIRLVDGTLGNDVAPFKIVKVGEKYKLASNSVEENKPVYAEEDKPVKESVSEVQAESAGIEIKPVITPDPVVEEAPAEDKVEEVVEKTSEETAEEEVKEVKAAKKTTKKTTKKKTAKTEE